MPRELICGDWKVLSFMTLCGGCTPVTIEQLELMLIELIQRTYGEPVAASSGRGDPSGRDGRVGRAGGRL